MTLSDVNDAASTKSGLDRTRSDFSIWFSVLVKISNWFSKFFPVCLRSERELSASTNFEQPLNANVIERIA